MIVLINYFFKIVLDICLALKGSTVHKSKINEFLTTAPALPYSKSVCKGLWNNIKERFGSWFNSSSKEQNCWWADFSVKMTIWFFKNWSWKSCEIFSYTFLGSQSLNSCFKVFALPQKTNDRQFNALKAIGIKNMCF